MIKKIVRRSLLKNKIMIISIFILFVLAAILSGTNNFAFPQAEKEVEKIVEKGHREEFTMFVNPLANEKFSDEYFKQVEENYDLEINYAPRYSIVEKNNSIEKTHVIEQYREDLTINKPVLVAGSFPLQKNEVLVSENAATALNQKIGDKITLNDVEYIISGFAYFSNYFMELDIYTSMSFLPDYELTQVYYMNEKSFTEIIPKLSDIKIEKISGVFHEDYSRTKRLDISKEILANETFIGPVILQDGSFLYDQNGGITLEEKPLFISYLDAYFNPTVTAIDSELSADSLMLNIFSYVINIISALLMIVLFNNVFKTQRREIGIVKAEGITYRELSVQYTKSIITILLISTVLGTIVAMFSARGIIDLIRQFYAFPFAEFQKSFLIIGLIEILLVLAVIVLAVYFFSIRRNLLISPLILIKNVDSESHPKIHITKFLKFLSFKKKYLINILLRNFSKVLLLTFAVFVSSFLLLMGSLSYDQINKLVNNNYAEQLGYDYEIRFTQDYDYPEVTSKSGAVYNLNLDKSDDKLSMKAFDSYNENIFKIENLNSKVIAHELYREGIVISSFLQNNFDLEIGDTVELLSPFDLETVISVEVVEVTNTLYQDVALIDINYLNELLGVDFYNTTFGNGSYEKLLATDPSATVIETDIFGEEISESLSIIYATIGVVVVIAVIISLITIGVISNIIIKKSSKTISIMKVLGYKDREIKNITTSAFKWIIVIVYFSTIPIIEKLIQVIIEKATSGLDFTFVIDIGWKFSLYGFLVLLFVYFVSANFAYRAIKKIDLSESLKLDE